MFKKNVEAKLREQFGDDEIVVKMAVEQDLIWSDHTEVRAYCDDGKVYSCLFYVVDQIGTFVEVPKEQK